jgi:hypothetical protein
MSWVFNPFTGKLDNTGGGGAGTGDVVGPAGATGDDIAVYDGATGKLIKDGGVKISGLVAANGAISGATKTKITYDAKGLVTSGADATTADIADSSDKRYCTDAQKTVIGNTSGTNSGDVTLASPDHGLGLTGQVITMGTPSTCTNATSNAVSTTTHTHQVTGFATGAGSCSGTCSGTNTGDQTVPVKATGAEIDTGTDDAKYVTSKAIADSAVTTATKTQTLTNKRFTNRITTIVSDATPTINTDNCDCVTITAQAAAITSMTTNLTGTPTNFQTLIYRIKDNGTARAITWGASFASRGVTLPTTTVISKVLTVGFLYNTVTSTWDCVSAVQEA